MINPKVIKVQSDEQMTKGQKSDLQWHPAFYASIQIEFEAERDKLTFENEHQLGTKPKQIDVLIIKNNSKEPIHKNIGRIFRTHNIIEYKSPTDYLSIDDFYLVYAYSCLYKADTANVDSIPANEITISFVCHAFPSKLSKYLRSTHNYSIEKQENGVYYVKGDFFPIQIIHTPELSKEENLWLRSLTNKINDGNDILTLMTEYKQKSSNKLYSSVMDIILKANKPKLKEEDDMCEAIKEIFFEVYGEAYEKEQQEALAEKDARIAEKDSALAEKDALIAELRAQLAATKA